MLTKTILMLIAYQGYQPIEYSVTRVTLENAGVKIVIASNKLGLAQAMPSDNHSKVCDDPNCRNIALENPKYAQVKVDITLDKVDISDYDGIVLIGGPGALEFLDNEVVYKLIQEMDKLEKPIAAICIAPRILANAVSLMKKSATCWNGDNKVTDLFKKHNVTFLPQSVVIDGNLITANGPEAVKEFAETIINLLKK